MQSNSMQISAALSIGLILVQLVAAAAIVASSNEAITLATKTRSPETTAGEARGISSKRVSGAESTSRKSSVAKLASPSRVISAHKRAKLQSRVMRSANPVEQIGESPLSSDAWSQHSLLPTFIDQEQGDEMVALASDSSESTQPQQVRKAPLQLNGSTSSLSDSYMKRYQTDRLQREQVEDERFLAREQQEQNKPRATSLVADDYYADDDDDDEQEQSAQLVKTDQRHSKQSAAGGANGQKVADFGPIDQSSSVKQVEKNTTGSEQAANGLERASGSGWLPTGSALREQTQDQRPDPVSMGRAEKVAGLFGTRGESTFANSFSKTDLAIEYLRNILKTKQSRLQSSQAGTNSSQVGQQQQQQGSNQEISRFDKGLKTFYPLPVQLREFAQPVNRTTASDQVKLSANELQETAGRFSINDVKQQTAQEVSSTVVPFVPIISTSPTETSPKQTVGEAAPDAVPKTSSSPNKAALEYALVNSATGTQLGGDYSDGHDEIPRGPHLVGQQTQQLQLSKNSASSVQPKMAESMAAQASDQLAAASTQTDGKFHFHSHQTFGPSHSSIYFDMRKPAERRPQAEFNDDFQQQVANVAPDFSKSIGIAGTQRNFDFDQANLSEFKQDQQIEPIPFSDTKLQRPAELGRPSSSPKSLGAPAQVPIEQQVVESDPKLDELANLERAPPAQIKVMPVKQPERQMISNKLHRYEQQAHFYEPQHQAQAPHSHSGPYQSADTQQQHHQNHQHAGYAAAYQPQQVPSQSHQAQQLGQPHQRRTPPQAQHHYHATQPELRPSYLVPSHQREQQPHNRQAKSPRIVSYNYFESSSGEHSQPTNFQLGDSLLSSTGDIEHTLSNSELDAIQSQFMSAEHPVVPIAEQQRHHNNNQQQHNENHNYQERHQELSKLLAGLRSSQTEMLQKPLVDPLRELASEEHASGSEPRQAERQSPSAEPKRKSLIVYLNHPRGDEMSRSAAASGETLAQLISEQTSGDPFVSAREFDSHGLAKKPTKLDVASLQGGGGALPKEALGDKDKDGLSVVVIGDAYKYKKIVLLISAKTGGLKFVPMVKDMK